MLSLPSEDLQHRADDLPADHPAEQGIGRPGRCSLPLGPGPFFTKELTDIKGLSTINVRVESITKAPGSGRGRSPAIDAPRSHAYAAEGLRVHRHFEQSTWARLLPENDQDRSA